MTPEEIRENPAYQEWLSEQTPSTVDDNEVRTLVQDDLMQGSSMSQFEYTLWRKWQKLQSAYGGASPEVLELVESVKNKIWIPKKPDDYLKLDPEVIYVKQQFPIRKVSIWGRERFSFLTNPDPLDIDWRILGDFVSTGDPSAGSVGRSLRFLVRDKKSKKYLGILSLANDFLELKARDEKIGWTREQRGNNKMIQHTAIGATIVPTQPLGYSYVGGKLMSLLLTTEPICSVWEKVYGKKLVGVTTTSLYGSEKTSSQYDGLKPYWQNLGNSAGSSVLRPTPTISVMLREWMKSKYPEEYWKYHQAKRETGLPLIRSSGEFARLFCYQKLKIPRSLYGSKHERGVYFSKLYNKSFEFLRGEITEKKLGAKRFDNSVEAVVERWKTKYASKRVNNLLKQDRFSFETSWYGELASLSWDQTREQFLPQ